jgi:hypothetical protein
MKRIINWLRYPWNFITQGLWTDCQHKRRRYGKHYFPECVDCGATFSDYHVTE